MKPKSDSYNIEVTGEDCACLGDSPSEPCWGQVRFTEEVCTEDGDCFFGCLCEGHMPMDERGAPYLPEMEV